MLCRCGGEEFVLLMPGADLLSAEALAERIRTQWQGQTFSNAQGVLSATVSIGYVCVSDGAEQGLYRLIDLADQALYDAKQCGRNCVRCWQPTEVLVAVSN